MARSPTKRQKSYAGLFRQIRDFFADRHRTIQKVEKGRLTSPGPSPNSPLTNTERGAADKTASGTIRPSGGVAQLVRVSACHAEGRGFEPRHSRHFFLKAVQKPSRKARSPVLPGPLVVTAVRCRAAELRHIRRISLALSPPFLYRPAIVHDGRNPAGG